MKPKRINAVNRVNAPSRVSPLGLDRMVPAKIAEIPRIPAIFQMFDPITTPTPTSGLLNNAAITAEPNSGREVPIADAVTPRIISDIPLSLQFRLFYQQKCLQLL